MKTKLTALFLAISLFASSQIKVKDLPETTTGKLTWDLIIDTLGTGGTRRISMANFIPAYSIVATNQSNTFGSFAQKFRSNNLFLTNPANTFSYRITGGAITAARNISFPYLLSDDSLVAMAAIQLLTNKTLGTGTKILLGSDATGDVYYNGGSGVMTRLAASTSGYLLSTNGAGTAPTWIAPPSAISGLTTNYIPIATSSTTIGNGYMYQSGNYIVVPTGKFITGTKTNKSRIDLSRAGTDELLIGAGGNSIVDKAYILMDTIHTVIYQKYNGGSSSNYIQVDSAQVSTGGLLTTITSPLKYTGSTPSSGKVLTSDASGNATWATATGSITGTGTNTYHTKWTGTSTQGNSLIYDNGFNVQIPASRYYTGADTTKQQFNLNGLANGILLTTDRGAGLKGELSLDDNHVLFISTKGTQMGLNASTIDSSTSIQTVYDNAIATAVINGILLQGNKNNAATRTANDNYSAVFINTKQGSFSSNVKNSVLIGGQTNRTVSRSNTVYVGDTLDAPYIKMPTGAGATKVFTSDAYGVGTWQTPSGGLSGATGDLVSFSATNTQSNIAGAASGKLLQAKGASTLPAYTTATYPSTSGTTQTFIQSDGTNFINSTITLPATVATDLIMFTTAANTIAANSTLKYNGTSGQWGNAATSVLSIGTPQPTTTDINHLFLGGNGVIIGQNTYTGEMEFGINYYYNSGFKYRFADTGGNGYCRAGRMVYSQSATTRPGDLDWETAPASTGLGGTLTWTTRMTLTNSGNLGIGTTGPSAKFHIINTTEQARIGYDASNYYKTTVGSTGGTTFDAVGSGSSFTYSDVIIPSAGIKGTTTNDDATALNVGEEIVNTVSTYANYTTTATYQAIDSITLTAGDWDLSAFATINFNGATITVGANTIFAVSTTRSSASGAAEGKNIAYIDQNALGTSIQSTSISPYRISISGSTKYYLNSQSTFTIGNPQYACNLRARRIR